MSFNFRPDYSPIDAHTDAAQKNYYYYTDWREKLIDSSRFYMRAGHENPRYQYPKLYQYRNSKDQIFLIFALC